MVSSVFLLPPAGSIPNGNAIDTAVKDVMTRTHANGMAVAVIDHGQVVYANAFGKRNAQGDPLTKDTIMYGASLTKTVFA
jgi:CubicO group peptidase (beta-lactamase class C family)